MKFIVLVLAIFFCVVSEVFAQGINTSGREFYTAFGPNSVYDPNVPGQFSVSIHAKRPTTVRIEVPTIGFFDTLNVQPDSLSVVYFPDGSGGNISVECIATMVNDRGRAVHITSDDTIEVVANSSKVFTGDAWQIYPSSSLGKEYYSVNYAEDPETGMISLPLTVGIIVIAATEDSTVIDIEPTDSCAYFLTKDPYHGLLYKGEVFVFAGDADEPYNDLTGSHIVANKPIVVLTGHQRVEVPTGYKEAQGTYSRDFLFEQAPPVNTWSRIISVAPFSGTSYPDVVRVISSADNNIITVNGIERATINKGEFFQLDTLSSGVTITGSAPILVAQYMHSEKNIAIASQSIGDPSLLLVRPLVIHPEPLQVIVPGVDRSDTSKNTISIVSTVNGLHTATIDGNTVSSAAITMPDGYHAYASVVVPGGIHSIQCSEPYSISVYGVQLLQSYAFTVPFDGANSPEKVDNSRSDILSGFSFGELYPNPASENDRSIDIAYNTQRTVRVSYTLIDSKGAVLSLGAKGIAAIGSGILHLELPAGLPSGRYIMRLDVEDMLSGVHSSYSRNLTRY